MHSSHHSHIARYFQTVLSLALLSLLAAPLPAAEPFDFPIRQFGFADIQDAAWLPGGHQFILGQGDRLSIVNAESGIVDRVFYGDTGAIGAFALTPDAKYVLAGGGDGTARLFDFESGALLRTFNHDPVYGVEKVALSDDASLAVTGGYKSRKLWNAVTGQLIADLGPTNHALPNGISTIKVSPDNTRILTVEDQSQINLWDSAGQLIHRVIDDDNTIYAAAFSRDGALMAVADVDFPDKVIHIVNTDTGTTISTVNTAGNHSRSIEFSPDASRLLVATQEDARLFSVLTGQLLQVYVSPPSDADPPFTHLTAARFSPDLTQVLTTSLNRTAVLYDTATGDVLRTIEGHRRYGVRSVAISDNNNLVLTGGHDATARLWSAGDGRLLRTYEANTSPVNAVAILPNQARILIAGDDALIRERDLLTGEVFTTYHGHGRGVTSIDVSTDGKRFVTGSADNSVRLWDVGSSVATRIYYAHADRVNFVDLSPDSTRLLTGGEDGSAFLWETDTQTPLFTYHHNRNQFRDRLQAGAISPDGLTVATAATDRVVKLWSATSGQLLHTFDVGEWVNALAFSPDGKSLLVDNYGNPLLYDLETKQIVRTFRGQELPLYDLVFSKNQQFIVGAHNEGYAMLWFAGEENGVEGWGAYGAD